VRSTNLTNCPVSRGGILAVVLVYTLFAALWILLSDKLVQLIFSDPDQIILVSMLKGWLYVGVTSLLLYGLMQRRVGGVAATKPTPVSSLWQSLPFLSLAAVIVALTGASIIHTFIHQKEEDVGRLQAVADLKAQQITDWLRERQVTRTLFRPVIFSPDSTAAGKSQVIDTAANGCKYSWNNCARMGDSALSCCSIQEVRNCGEATRLR
jgi:hypothetical protein